MATKPYIQLMRNQDVELLLTHHINAFRLLTFIALRARRSVSQHRITKLKQNQAFIGDFKKMGMSEQNYRTAKQKLEEFSLATFKATNRGTIATLYDSAVYNINPAEDNEPDNIPITDGLTDNQRTGNGRVTTNKNGKKENNGENVEEYPHLLSVFEKDLTIANGIAALRAGHPAFIKTADIHLENAFKDQVDRSKWYEAVKGLIKAYAPPAELPRPNHTLSNWLAGKPSEKNGAADPVGKRLNVAWKDED